MNWDMIGAIAELIGAFAVVVTFVYLAVQVRDSARAARLSAVQSQRELRIEMFNADRDSPYLAEIEVKLAAGTDLSPEEEFRHSRHLSGTWAYVYADWVQRDLGLVGEYATQDRIVEFLLSNSRAMEWWDRSGELVYPDRFISYVNEMRTRRA